MWRFGWKTPKRARKRSAAYVGHGVAPSSTSFSCSSSLTQARERCCAGTHVHVEVVARGERRAPLVPRVDGDRTGLACARWWVSRAGGLAERGVVAQLVVVEIRGSILHRGRTGTGFRRGEHERLVDESGTRTSRCDVPVMGIATTFLKWFIRHYSSLLEGSLPLEQNRIDVGLFEGLSEIQKRWGPEWSPGISAKYFRKCFLI